MAYRLEAQFLEVASFPGLDGTVVEIASSQDSFLGAVVNGELVGVARIEANGKEQIEIASLVVQPNYHRRGIASALLESAFIRAGSKPVVVATAASNTPALRLYAKHGFEVFSTEPVREEKIQIVRLQRVRPNPSLKRSANGGPPGPVCGEVHSPQPGPGIPPLSPA